jgi:hypothetical protein
MAEGNMMGSFSGLEMVVSISFNEVSANRRSNGSQPRSLFAEKKEVDGRKKFGRGDNYSLKNEVGRTDTRGFGVNFFIVEFK